MLHGFFFDARAAGQAHTVQLAVELIDLAAVVPPDHGNHPCQQERPEQVDEPFSSVFIVDQIGVIGFVLW